MTVFAEYTRMVTQHTRAQSIDDQMLHMAIGIALGVCELEQALMDFDPDDRQVIEKLGDIEFYLLSMYQCYSQARPVVVAHGPRVGTVAFLRVALSELLAAIQQGIVHKRLENITTTVVNALNEFRLQLDNIYYHYDIDVTNVLKTNIQKVKNAKD